MSKKIKEEPGLEELRALFNERNEKTGGWQEVGVKVIIEGKEYKASSLIDTLATEVLKGTHPLKEGKTLGELTLAGYVLLEILTRKGFESLVEAIISDSSLLFHSALCTAIGMRAGVLLPEEATFETTYPNSPAGLWTQPGGEN